ncbi:hypothetical protein DLM85_21305 [Hymenobacter edaphi]|uniref:Uncharacterized protein n=1 Tax=Hymenobacter edaphi TaxID=2211146 RepID=A0A328BAQ2_9BACT|nr:hypothetical protein DLM85_21305 [Hymenobacter edaphi]
MTDCELSTLANSSAELAAEELLLIFQQVGARGDVMLYKHDGARSENRFTIMALISGYEGVCRRDGDSLSVCVQDCLRQYLAAKARLGN